MDYYAIDFETANENLSSACSIGIVGVLNDKIVSEEHYLINPEEYFNDFNVSIHHITYEMVENMPTFKELWPKIEKYFNNTIIIAHNAVFDVSVLKACIEKYEIKAPDFKFSCTVKISQEVFVDGFKDHKLGTMSQYLEVEHLHHDALSDARVCVYIVNRAQRITQSSSLYELSKKIGYSFGTYNSTRYFPPYKNVSLSMIDEIFEKPLLLDKVFFITGKSKNKREIVNKIIICGGIVEKRFRDNCDFLVLLDEPDMNYFHLANNKKYISIINQKDLLEIFENDTIYMH